MEERIEVKIKSSGRVTTFNPKMAKAMVKRGKAEYFNKEKKESIETKEDKTLHQTKARPMGKSNMKKNK